MGTHKMNTFNGTYWLTDEQLRITESLEQAHREYDSEWWYAAFAHLIETLPSYAQAIDISLAVSERVRD